MHLLQQCTEITGTLDTQQHHFVLWMLVDISYIYANYSFHAWLSDCASLWKKSFVSLSSGEQQPTEKSQPYCVMDCRFGRGFLWQLCRTFAVQFGIQLVGSVLAVCSVHLLQNAFSETFLDRHPRRMQITN